MNGNSLRLFWLFFIILLAGCSLQPVQPAPGSDLTPYFRPPTIPPPTAEPQVATPTAQVSGVNSGNSCVDDLKYVRDVTIPDNTQVKPGDVLDKEWEVRNTGSCDWVAGYTLQLASGSAMGASTSQTLFPALSGTNATLKISFTVPQTARGLLISSWQAYNSSGQPFGEPVFIQIEVVP